MKEHITHKETARSQCRIHHVQIHFFKLWGKANHAHTPRPFKEPHPPRTNKVPYTRERAHHLHMERTLTAPHPPRTKKGLYTRERAHLSQIDKAIKAPHPLRRNQVHNPWGIACLSDKDLTLQVPYPLRTKNSALVTRQSTSLNHGGLLLTAPHPSRTKPGLCSQERAHHSQGLRPKAPQSRTHKVLYARGRAYY